MYIQKLAWVFGVVFLAVGLLGFVPGVTTNGHLLGIFEVDTLHNIIHIASGVLAAIAASLSVAASRLYFKVFGVIYGLVTIAGFVQGDTVFGLLPINMADNVLHLLIAGIALFVGFFVRSNVDIVERPRKAAGPGEPLV